MAKVKRTVRRLTPEQIEAERIAAITPDQMERAIHDLADEEGAENLLSIPGVWEIVAEHYNNDAIARVLEESEGA